MKFLIYVFILFFVVSCSTVQKDADTSVKQENKEKVKESPYIDTTYTAENNLLIFEFETEGDVNGKWREYYTNGVLKETGQMNDEFGCTMNTGEFCFYNSLGKLESTKFYNNWLENSDDGCHSTRQDITVKEYHKNGSLKVMKYYQSSYEGEEYEHGDWLYFDTSEYVIKLENHKGPFSSSKFEL